MELIGKTIKDIKRYGVEGVDDEPYIKITFSDDTEVMIYSCYGGYSGNSFDEYPAYIGIDNDMSNYANLIEVGLYD